MMMSYVNHLVMGYLRGLAMSLTVSFFSKIRFYFVKILCYKSLIKYFSETEYRGNKDPRLNELSPDEGENSTLFDMISGKKFLAAVVSGSCVGKSSFISGHTG